MKWGWDWLKKGFLHYFSPHLNALASHSQPSFYLKGGLKIHPIPNHPVLKFVRLLLLPLEVFYD